MVVIWWWRSREMVRMVRRARIWRIHVVHPRFMRSERVRCWRSRPGRWRHRHSGDLRGLTGGDLTQLLKSHFRWQHCGGHRRLHLRRCIRKHGKRKLRWKDCGGHGHRWFRVDPLHYPLHHPRRLKHSLNTWRRLKHSLNTWRRLKHSLNTGLNPVNDSRSRRANSCHSGRSADASQLRILLENVSCCTNRCR